MIRIIIFEKKKEAKKNMPIGMMVLVLIFAARSYQEYRLPRMVVCPFKICLQCFT